MNPLFRRFTVFCPFQRSHVRTEIPAAQAGPLCHIHRRQPHPLRRDAHGVSVSRRIQGSPPTVHPHNNAVGRGAHTPPHPGPGTTGACKHRNLAMAAYGHAALRRSAGARRGSGACTGGYAIRPYGCTRCRFRCRGAFYMRPDRTAGFQPGRISPRRAGVGCGRKKSRPGYTGREICMDWALSSRSP